MGGFPIAQHLLDEYITCLKASKKLCSGAVSGSKFALSLHNVTGY